MPEEDDGIGPFIAKYKPTAPSRVRDLSSGVVRDSGDATLNGISAKAQPWRFQIDTAMNALKPEVDPVSGKTSGLANRVPDPSGVDFSAGLISGEYLQALRGLNSVLSAPFSTFTDLYQAEKVNNAIKQFSDQNGQTLHDMNTSMALAQKNLDEISDLAQRFHPSGGKARGIMDQKRKPGDDMMAQIDEAIPKNTDTHSADMLQGIKDDWSNWLASRDQRVNSEQTEVNQLDARASSMSKQASVDGSTFSRAAQAADKLIGGGADPNTAYTQHITGAAQNMAQQLQQALIYSRAQFESTLK